MSYWLQAKSMPDKDYQDRNMRKFGLLMILSLMISGCGNAPESVEQRAEGRWTAILSDDLSAAYEYFSPGYRSSVTLNQYIRTLSRTRVSWTGATVKSKSCTDTACDVFLNVKYKVTTPVPGVDEFESNSEVTEKWLKIDEEWYYLPEN